MECIHPSKNNPAHDNAQNRYEGDDGDDSRRSWIKLKAHYLDNPDNNVLSTIIEN